MIDISADVVYAAVAGVLNQLDPCELPETCGYLSSLPGEDDRITVRPYEMVSAVMSLDKPRKFPEFLVDFLVGMLMLEIAEDNTDAMNDLGAYYYDGSRGFEQSFEQAIHYYKMAAEKGNRQAQENLGYCYYYGRDGNPDYEKAFHYFALGAFDGHLVSLYKIGDMYLNGLFVPPNAQEAFHIFLRVLHTMTPEAEPRVAGPVYLRLGRMFQFGTGTEQNLKNALVCYQKAESHLYDMVLDGDGMYRKSLRSAIEGQHQVRARLAEELPEDTWDFDG